MEILLDYIGNKRSQNTMSEASSYPIHSLAINIPNNTVVKVCNARDNVRTVVDTTGVVFEAVEADLGPFELGSLTKQQQTKVMKHLSEHLIGTLSQKITPSMSSAIVSIRAFSSSTLSLPEFAEFAAEYALKVAAESDAQAISALFCTVSQTLLTAADQTDNCIASVACWVWCAEACRSVAVAFPSEYISNESSDT